MVEQLLLFQMVGEVMVEVWILLKVSEAEVAVEEAPRRSLASLVLVAVAAGEVVGTDL